jgi:hypothetical protein
MLGQCGNKKRRALYPTLIFTKESFLLIDESYEFPDALCLENLIDANGLLEV